MGVYTKDNAPSTNSIIFGKEIDLIYGGAVKEIKDKLDGKLSFSAQLHQNHLLGLHLKARGVAPDDTFPYDEGELKEARKLWVNEVNESILPLAEKLPSTHFHAARRMKDKALSRSDVEALEALVRTLQKLSDELLIPIDADFSDIQEFASNLAEGFYKRAEYRNKCPNRADQMLADDISDVEALTGWTKPDNISAAGFYARTKDPKFWMRHLQKKLRLISIQAARVLQILGTGRGRAEYLPADVVRRKHQQIDFMQDWMERTILTSNDNRQVSLAEATKDAPLRQLAELEIRSIARAKAAFEKGWSAYFLTVTVPSRFHPTRTVGPKKGRKWSVPNPNFDPNLTPVDSINWIQKNWQDFRALAQKICGSEWDFFAGTEGHTDATGHRHNIIFCPPEHAEEMRQAAISSFLLSDSPDEPGAKKHRVEWEAARSEGGVIKYIMDLLRYPLKTIAEGAESGGKPSAEALFTKATGKRTFSTSHDFVGQWRWLRARPEPFGLPEELVPAWCAAHGLSEDQLPSKSEYEDEQFGKFKNGINGEVTRPSHYLDFLKSVAPQYKPAWLESHYYDVVDKNIDDFRIETANPTTGEIDDYEAYEAMRAAWYAAWGGDDSLIVKSKTRLLNGYGEPKNPSGGAEKAPILYREDNFARVTLARRSVTIWTKETILKKKEKPHAIAKISAEKETALQLSIQSQGGRRPLVKPTGNVDPCGFSVDAQLAKNNQYTAKILELDAAKADRAFQSFYAQIIDNEKRKKATGSDPVPIRI